MTAAAGYDYLIEYRRIEWRPFSAVDPRPLNRHVRHDSRSKAYAYPERDPATLMKVDWTGHIGVLDQGNTGSCTGNAATGNAGTTPFWETLVTKLAAGLVLDETYARDTLYHLATTYDSFDGTYPPTDTGSDGLSVAKAAQSQGLINGYQHALSMDAALAALQRGPVITGVNWYDGFDSPDANGLVHKTGSVRGGHEFVVVGYDPATKLVKARNSWGTGYGVGGYFYFSDTDWAALLAEQGDVTVFVPLNQPVPAPTPVPPPGPTPTPDDPAALAMVIAGNVWERTIWSQFSKAGRFKTAFEAWKAAHGW